MTPQLYIELDTNLEIAKLEEWIGREYCRSVPCDYPQAPTEWDGMPPPWPPENQPPANAYTYFYTHAKAKDGNGGVYKLDDAVIGFATQAQALSDGSSYSLDLTANAKTFEQLTPAGQVAATPSGPFG
jgi:hypothetical protein